MKDASARVAEVIAKAEVEHVDGAVVALVLEEFETLLDELVAAHREVEIQADEMQTAQAQLVTERRRYAELFEQAPDGYLVTDGDGKIIEANRAAGEITGLPSGALVGSLLATHVQAGDRRVLREYLARAVAKRVPIELVAGWLRTDGGVCSVGIRASASTDVDGAARVRWIVRDFTRRDELEHELELAQGELAALSGLTSLLRLTSDADSRAVTLRRIVAVAETAHPQLRAGTTLVEEGELTTAASPSDLARELNDLQHRLGIGPCVEALARGERVIGDVAANEREWGEFGRRAVASGVAQVLAFPLMIDDTVRGALNAYALEPVTPQVLGVLETLAAQSATAVANADLFAGAAKLAQDLTTALQSRAPIEQAKGILMAREGVDADAAFDILRRASQRTNRKLRDIAAEVVQNLPSREG